jgi:hypothetical protein
MELRRRSWVRAFIVLATAVQLLAIVFGVSALLNAGPAIAAQSVPYKVNFQGRLTDNSGNVLSDGLYNVKFRLWTLASGGTNQWEEDRVMTGTDNRIQITNGLFNIQFGDLTAIAPGLFNVGTGTLYLEVELPTPATATCATNGCAVFTEGAMTPRQPLASSPYAVNSDTLDGLDSSAFGQLSAANTWTGANQIAPTTSSTVALKVKATTAGSTNSLEVFDSANIRQAYFDANGLLVLSKTLNEVSNIMRLGPVDYSVSASSMSGANSAYFVVDKGNTASDATAVFRDQGAIRGEIGLQGDNNIHIKTASGVAGSETFIDRLIVQTTGEVYTTGKLGVGGVPTEQLHVSASSTSARILTKIENTNAAASSKASGVELKGGSTVDWTVGTDIGLNGNNNFAIQDNIFGYQPRLLIDSTGQVGLGTDAPSGSLTFATGSDRTINVNTAVTGNAGNKLSLLAGNGLGTNQAGGDLILRGGASTGIGTGGAIIAKPQTDSVGAFQVQNAAGKALLAVDSAGSQTLLGTAGTGGINGKLVFNTTNASNFESSFTASASQGANLDYTLPTAIATNGVLTTTAGGVLSWSTSGASLTSLNPSNLTTGSGAVILQSAAATSLTLTGAAGVTVSASGTAQNISLTPSTTGTVIIGGTAPTITTAASAALIVDAGAGTLSLGTSANNKTINIGATGATANTTAVNIANTTTGGASTVQIGGTGVTSGSNAASTVTLQGGQTSLSVANAGVTAQSFTNSATAFQVQNSIGAPIFLVDTITNNLITNPGFEVNTTTGWTPVTATLTRNTTTGQNYQGIASMSVNVTTLGGGAQATGFNAAVTPGTYVFSFSAMNSTAGTLGVTIVGGSAPACTLASGAMLTTGFQRYTCSFTSTTTNVTAITVTSSTTGLFYLDAVQLMTSANNANVYDIGNIQLRGIVNNPAAFQSVSNSTSAFQIQNVTGTSNLFIADTINSRIGIGTAAPTQALEVNGTAKATAFIGSGASLTSLDPTQLTTGSGAVTLQALAASTLTVDSGTTGALNIGTGTTSNKTINIGATATNTNTTILNLAVNTAGTQDVNIGSAGFGDAAAGTFVSIQGGTTANTAIMLGTNAGGGITIDSGTTGAINIANNANAKTVTIGNITGATALNLLGGASGSVNLGSVASSTASSTTNIANTNNATGTQIVSIGSAQNAANSVTLEAGNTGTIAIGNGATAHTINVGTGAAIQLVNLGSANSTSKTNLQGGIITTTTNNSGIIIGAGYGADTNLVGLTLDSSSTFTETAGTCAAAANGGTIYYNSTTNAVRGCINGSWEDMVSTASLGLQLLGVVPDSGATAPGDLVSIGTVGNGPCKVYMGSTTNTIRWSGCTAFSGGRKIIVAAQGSDFSTNMTATANAFQYLCLNGTNNAPQLITSTSTTDNNPAIMPAFSVASPVLCLATILKTAAGTAIQRIYDTRTFTTTTKQAVNIVTTAPAYGWLVTNTTTAGQYTPTNAAAGGRMTGVVVATAAGTTANSINAIIAVNGPAYIKATNASGTNLVGDTIQTIAQAGLASLVTTFSATTAYANAGIAQSNYQAGACAANSDNCRGSVFTNLMFR